MITVKIVRVHNVEGVNLIATDGISQYEVHVEHGRYIAMYLNEEDRTSNNAWYQVDDEALHALYTPAEGQLMGLDGLYTCTSYGS